MEKGYKLSISYISQEIYITEGVIKKYKEYREVYWAGRRSINEEIINVEKYIIKICIYPPRYYKIK